MTETNNPNPPEPQPSRPTTAFGAPNIGAHRSDGTWTWNDPDSRPACWKAFGEPGDQT